MSKIEILAHRGWWTSREDQNSLDALTRALTAGFGVETDIRDCAGRLVVSHDMPTAPRLLEAAEKRTISRVASAGVNFFRSISVYLRALAYSLDHEESQTYNGLFYVCPVLNGVRDQNLTVVLETVDTVLDIKDMTAPSKI